MQKIFFRIISIIFAVTVLSGCLAENNVKLPNNFWKNNKQHIVVAVSKPPTPQVYQMGMQGLLDYAINLSVNQKINHFLSKKDLVWYYNLPGVLSTRLHEKNIQAYVYHDKNLEIAKKDYSSLAYKLKGDKLLILRLESFGLQRQYYGFIPLGKPEATCHLKGELIDVKNNMTLWRQNSDILVPIEGEWDQPPYYPNVTIAIDKAILLAKQQILNSFFSQ